MTDTASSRPTHLFLVRHGRTAFNRDKIVQGRGVDAPLDEKGRRQARALARRAATLDLDVIYSSTLLRARETAAIVSERCGRLPVICLNDLEELSWGKYEGRPRTPELKAVFLDMVARWQAGQYDYAVEGGESVLDVLARARRAVDFILDEHVGHRVMVVAHGRFFRILIADLLEEYGLPRMEEVKHSNTGLNHLVHEEGRFRALCLNDTTHLEVAA